MALFGNKKEKHEEKSVEDEISAIKAFVEGTDKNENPAGGNNQNWEEQAMPKQERHRIPKAHELFGEEHEEPKPKQQPVKNDGEKHEQRTAAPIFVKLDKYRDILVSLGHLKATVVALKNSMEMLQELDEARMQTAEVMQKAMENIDNRIAALDQELVKPKGFREISRSPDYDEVENVEATIADLKGQIEQLRSEIEQV
jgi:hypothetical protein